MLFSQFEDLIEQRWVMSLYIIPAKLSLVHREQQKDIQCSSVKRYRPAGPLCQRGLEAV